LLQTYVGEHLHISLHISLFSSEHKNILNSKYDVTNTQNNLGSYYKSKLDLKSNLSEILPINCKFICVQIFLFCAEIQI